MSSSTAAYSFSDICDALGKSPFYVRNLQKTLGLPLPDGRKDEKKKRRPRGKKMDQLSGGYCPRYLTFLEKVVAMRAFNVPLARIAELFELEKKILVLLHLDGLYNSDTWYFGAAGSRELTDGHLLLTGHDLGFPLVDGAIQHNLDFAEREAELFNGEEMGEDVRRVLTKYHAMLQEIQSMIRREQPVLRNALDWAEAMWGMR